MTPHLSNNSINNINSIVTQICFPFCRRQIARCVFGLGYFTSVEYCNFDAFYVYRYVVQYDIELAAHRHASHDPAESAFCVNVVYET